MANCECLAGCIFFNDKMSKKPGTAEIYKKKYCLGDNVDCARYMVFQKLGKANVPADLYPNQSNIAQKLITDS